MTGTANAMTRDHLGLCRWESCGQSTLNLTDLVTGKQVASFKAGGCMTMPWETEKDNITVMSNCQDSIWMRLVVASGIIEADRIGGRSWFSCSSTMLSTAVLAHTTSAS